MPIEEQDKILQSTVVPEISKIKIGERGGRNGAPSKIDPIVTKSLKPKGGVKFEEDKVAMQSIAAHLKGLGAGAPKTGIPVRLMSDDINDNFFFYRAIYNGANVAMCFSPMGSEKALRRYGEHRYTTGLKVLETPKEVDCNKDCPEWLDPGEKGVCSWSSILAVQLDIPGYRRFPSQTLFRTKGWQVFKYMIGSLNTIASITNGVLANIPLLLVMHEVEGFAKSEGKRRRYPVMSFEFMGTMDQLRSAAIAELNSRNALRSASRGVIIDAKIVDSVVPKANALLGGDTVQTIEEGGGDVVDVDNLMELMDAGEAPLSTASETQEAGPAVEAVAKSEPEAAEDDMMSLMAGGEDVVDADEPERKSLAQKLRMSDTAYQALVDKYAGDMDAVLDDLRRMSSPPAKTTPPASPPPAAAAKVAQAKPAPTIDDEAEELLGMMGETSDEPSEVDVAQATPDLDQSVTASAPAAAENTKPSETKATGWQAFENMDDDQ